MGQAPTNRLTPTALAGASLLLAATLWRLPNPLALFHPPQTPYDRTNRRLQPAFVLLTEARAVLPPGAWVTIVSEPPDPILDTDAQHLGAALLPGRVVIPAARFGAPRPDLVRRADYVVVVGATPAKPPGERLLERAQGSVWWRRPS